jgi:hypothetical protein
VKNKFFYTHFIKFIRKGNLIISYSLNMEPNLVGLDIHYVRMIANRARQLCSGTHKVQGEGVGQEIHQEEGVGQEIHQEEGVGQEIHGDELH